MNEVIEVMTYEQWKQEYKQKQKRTRRKRKKEFRKLQQYFLKQKLYGFLIVLLGLIVGCAANILLWDNLFALGSIIMICGLYVMITRRMIIADSYFLEM